jgi:hypothetical protein
LPSRKPRYSGSGLRLGPTGRGDGALGASKSAKPYLF